MLVCPHCQFENPDTNKFCQSCGGALTEEAYASDDRSLLDSASFNSDSDSNFEMECIRLAILSHQAQQAPTEGKPTNSSEIAVFPESELVDGKYLDLAHRYQLLQPLPEQADGTQELEIQVLDHQPLGTSNLQALYQTSLDEPDATIALTTLPVNARLYLELQEHYPSLPLPELHDAWEQNGYSVLLLKDRTTLPSLVEVCQDETVLPLQILYWLHEMVEYWTVLQPRQQCQSLLKLDNLRVDPEDDVLCLRRLYADSPDAFPTLSTLGTVWQTLFEQSRRTQHGDLFLLCRDLEDGMLNSIEELRSRIEEIAHNLQQLANLTTSASTDLPDVILPPLEEPKSIASDKPAENYVQVADHNEAIVNEGDDQPTVVLPMQLISIEDAGRTITGRQREHNEDSFYIQTDVKRIETKRLDDSQERVVQAKGLYILCDGMGGHAGGEVASALAVDTLRQYFAANWQDKLPNEQSIREAIYLTNQAIYDQNQDNARMGSGRMGTTLVLVLIHNADVAIAHVGDSRLYRFSRRRGLEQLTVDHEVGQREIQRGVEPSIAYARPDAYQLTQALGPRDEGFINPDVTFFELNEDTLLLLCSDGVTDNELLELHQQNHLAPLLDVQTNLEQGLNELIELANQFNGHDNITAIAIRARVRPNLTQVNHS
jgi:protein phosphatase